MPGFQYISLLMKGHKSHMYIFFSIDNYIVDSCINIVVGGSMIN